MSADAKIRNAQTSDDVTELRAIVEVQQQALEALEARMDEMVAALAGLVVRVEALEDFEQECKAEDLPVEAPNEPVDAEIRIATGVGAGTPP